MSREAAFWAVLGAGWGVPAGRAAKAPDQNAEDCYWAPIPSGPVGSGDATGHPAQGH